MLEKAFKLFAEYAQKVEEETYGVRVPSLQIHRDKSGCIRANSAPYTYLTFNSIEHLIEQLEQIKQGDSNATNN
jgi:hypothetical protein